MQETNCVWSFYCIARKIDVYADHMELSQLANNRNIYTENFCYFRANQSLLDNDWSRRGREIYEPPEE